MNDRIKELRVWLEKEQGYSPKQKSSETIATLEWTIRRLERCDDLEDKVEDLIKQCNQLGHIVSEFASLENGPCIDGCKICTQFAREMDEAECMEHVPKEEVWWRD